MTRNEVACDGKKPLKVNFLAQHLFWRVLKTAKQRRVGGSEFNWVNTCQWSICSSLNLWYVFRNGATYTLKMKYETHGSRQKNASTRLQTWHWYSDTFRHRVQNIWSWIWLKAGRYDTRCKDVSWTTGFLEVVLITSHRNSLSLESFRGLGSIASPTLPIFDWPDFI